MRPMRSLAMSIFLTACSSGSSKTVTTVDIPMSPSTSEPSNDSIFGPPGPIRIVGYPVNVGSGFAAVAHAAGFTSKGEQLGVCYINGGSDDATCLWQDRER